MSVDYKKSAYLKFLPAIYQQDDSDAHGLSNRILLACEKMLTGIDDDVAPISWGLEKILDEIQGYFDPETTPEVFLEWLAGWMALDLMKGKDWDDPDFTERIQQLIEYSEDYCKSNTSCDTLFVSRIKSEIEDLKAWDGADPLMIEQLLIGIGDPETSWILKSVKPEDVASWLSVKLNEISEGTIQTRQHLPHTMSSRNRTLIRKLIPLFHARGTRYGFEQILLVYLGYLDCTFVINELLNPFRIGGLGPAHSDRAEAIQRAATSGNDLGDVTLRELADLGNRGELTSVIGCSTVVGEGAPYYFRVTVDTKTPVCPTALQKKKRMIAPIIDQEKPAHTYYSLKISAPGMQIGEINNHVKKYHCTIGVDTLIGGLTI